jgi:hypothetical protein
VIPQDVQNYINAQDWLFIYRGLPLFGIYMCWVIAGQVREYLDDRNVNDDTPRESGKYLDL